MRISEKERLTELYYCLKAVPMELWESENYQIVINALAEKKLNEEQSISFHIFGRLAHNLANEEEFLESIKSDRISPIHLTLKETNLLKKGLKKAAKSISKGSLGGATDSLKIFQYYYAKAA